MVPNFYRGRICLNVLADDVENMKDVYEAAEGHVLFGVLSSDFETVADAKAKIDVYNKAVNGAVSLGLGAGDPGQSEMVAVISKEVIVSHINQVFPAVGRTRGGVKLPGSYINSLVQPTGKLGMVNIATGPMSSEEPSVDVPVEVAITLMKEMGGNAVKFFPMNGLETKEQYRAVAKACAERDFILEPTGGINLENFEEILTIALQAGVKRIIPHVYSSIIDKESGQTRVEDVSTLYNIMKKVVEKHG